MNIGMNIRRRRMEAGITQEALAEQVGVARSMIAQIERGTKACSMQLGLDIAKALGVDVMALYEDQEEDGEAAGYGRGT